jgi:hypothetical protein
MSLSTVRSDMNSLVPICLSVRPSANQLRHVGFAPFQLS